MLIWFWVSMEMYFKIRKFLVIRILFGRLCILDIDYHKVTRSIFIYIAINVSMRCTSWRKLYLILLIFLIWINDIMMSPFKPAGPSKHSALQKNLTISKACNSIIDKSAT